MTCAFERTTACFVLSYELKTSNTESMSVFVKINNSPPSRQESFTFNFTGIGFS